MTALPPDVAADLRQENARLRAELRIARDRQNASADILRTIADASGDAERSLYQIAETSMRLFGATSATIQIAEGDGWSQTIRVGDSSKSIGAGVPEAQLRIGGRNMPGTIVAENRQVHVPDLDNVDPAIADWPGLPYARAAGTRSMSGSPLRREGKAIGTLIVYRDRLAPFTDEEMALQQSFADQAAIAIENARLFNETREALERQTATAEILKVIASSPSDVQPVFDAIADKRQASVRRRRPDWSRAYPATWLILPPSPRAARPATRRCKAPSRRRYLPRGFTARWRAPAKLRSGPISRPSPTFRRASRIWRAPGAYRSIIVVPLLREGVPIGTISVTRRDPGPFSGNHIDLLQNIRRSGRDRDRECAAVQRITVSHQRPDGSAAPADRHRRRAQGDQPLDLRSAAGA